MQTWQAVLLGIIEGLTEFIPVSSTGHLVLAEALLGVQEPAGTFKILIQLGAILAILSVYAARLLGMAAALPSSAETRRFVLAVLVAFLPAAVLGATFHKHIKLMLQSPLIVCISLIVGGIILLVVDRAHFRQTADDVMQITPLTALKIGAFQCLAMIPGVSRSGATIVGAMLLGVGKRAAAEFSFFLAMPTMAGAFAYDLFKSYKMLAVDDVINITVGFVVAFAVGVFVVRHLLEFVSSRGFAPFAWYRIVLGGVGLGALLVMG